MHLSELLSKNRSYRGFVQEYAIDYLTLEALISLTRLAPSTSNKQPLRYFLSCEAESNAIIQPLTRWGGRMKGKKLPYPGHMPTAFIIICHDLALSPNPSAFEKDVGIVAHTILLGATEQGLGGCMIGGFSSDALAKALSLSDTLIPMLIVALGKPCETIVLEDATTAASDGYYRDESDVHHVIKRTLNTLILNPLQTEKGTKDI